jgi:hypothetical protein
VTLFHCPTGKSVARFLCDLMRGMAIRGEKSPVLENLFREVIQGEAACAWLRRKILLSLYRKLCIMPISRLDERGVRAVVTICEAGMRWTCWSRSVTICADERADADVKSCGPGLPVLRSRSRQRSRVAGLTGARQPVPGEITYKR